jgi:hypothetical protein
LRLIQFVSDTGARRVGVIDGSANPRELNGLATTRELALAAFRAGRSIAEEIEFAGLGATIDYAAVIKERRLLLPLDHSDPAHCVLAITGLTHLGSAKSRDAMHVKIQGDDLSDSMKIFKWGVEGGKPVPGAIGVQPEWAYKGDGAWTVIPGAPIVSPGFAEDGGEEAEIVGLYVIGDGGEVLRVGYALGNEFSDHIMERRNYLYLAHSKLRQSSYGPELLVGELPPHVTGTARVLRDGAAVWSAEFISGEENMCHSIKNLEQHHFKYAAFRRPGDIHVYYFGASVLSCTENFALHDGDVMEIASEIFGAPLINPLRVEKPAAPVAVVAL